MQFDSLIALVPLSRIDPEPSELTERIAEATLASFSALWHPAILSRSSRLPVWNRAADPPTATPGQLLLIPEASRRFLPHAWEDQAQAAGAQLIAGEDTRAGFLTRLRDTLSPDSFLAADPAGASEFLALGLARLWLEMLTSYMRHVSTLDEDHFQKEVLAAASAAVLSDAASRDDHLRAAYQTLTEARERLYAAEIHLLDLCLLHPNAGMDRLARQLGWGLPVNVFLSGQTADELRSREPATSEQLRAALDAGKAELVGGEFDEVDSTLLPIESHLWQFRRGEHSYREAFGRTPLVFGRRRFGFARHVLQLLNRLEMTGFMHFCFDDGVFPPAADPKVRYEAPDTGTVEALTRVPFAADNALEFLKLPWRLAQTIAADQVATLSLVHWPMPDCPWYEDLLRMTRQSSVFGRFTTAGNYFAHTDPSSISKQLSSDDYASPFLAAAHHRGAKQPISEFAVQHRSCAGLETVRWLWSIDRAVRGQPSGEATELGELEELCETQQSSAAERIAATTQRIGPPLADLVNPPRAGGEPGLLLFNSLCFDRRVIVPRSAQTNPSDAEAEPPWVSVAVPAMGFAWIPRAAPAAPSAPDSTDAVVDAQTLRNEFLEVELDATTGGIRSLSDRATGASHIGQQLVLVGILSGVAETFDAAGGADDYGTTGYGAEPPKSQMRATSFVARSAGPELAELVVHGDLIAEPTPAWASDAVMARFRQTYRLGRGQQALRVAVEILDLKAGAFDAKLGPWQSYLGSRFAWRDPRQLLVRAVGSLAEPTRSQRPESPYFVELHGRTNRTAVLTGGLPFQQRVGDRMLDLLLLTATETCRIFEFAIGIDLPNPFHAALDLITPPAMIATETGPPPVGPAGWFFHLDTRAVVVTSMTPLNPECCGVRLRLFESAGRYTRAKLRCVRDVREARMTDFHGQRLATLDTQGDQVSIDLSPHEITQIEIEFA